MSSNLSFQSLPCITPTKSPPFKHGHKNSKNLDIPNPNYFRRRSAPDLIGDQVFTPMRSPSFRSFNAVDPIKSTLTIPSNSRLSITQTKLNSLAEPPTPLTFAEPLLPEYYNQLEQRIRNNETISKLYQIAKSISQLHGLDQVKQFMIKECTELLNASDIYVYLVKNDYVQHPSGYIKEGILGYCASTAEIVNLNSNPLLDPRYVAKFDTPEDMGYAPQFMLFIPLVSSEVINGIQMKRVVAVMQAIKGPPMITNSPFNENDGLSILSLGAFMGSILRSSQLMEQALRASHRSEVLMEVGRALMSEHQLDILISLIISEVPELIDAERCTLFFVDMKREELIIKRSASFGTKKLVELRIRRPSRMSATPGNGTSFNDGALSFGGKSEIRIPMGAGIAAYVAKTGETLNIPDAYKDSRFNPSMDKKTGYTTRTILCVPLLDSNGEVLGVLQALNKSESLGPFTADDELVLKTFAGQAAIAVRNCQLFNATQRALQRSEALLMVTNAISKELDITLLIGIIVSKVQYLLNSEKCSLFIVDNEHKQLYSTKRMIFAMGRPIDAHIDDAIVRFPLDRGIAGHVAQTGEMINIADFSKAENRFNIDDSDGLAINSILCIPIIDYKNDIVGVIQVLNKSVGEYTSNIFDEEDVKLLKAFASQTAVAIANSRLFEETRKALNHALKQQRELKFKLDFTQNLVSEMQTAQMVRQMAKTVTEMFSVDYAVIFLLDLAKEELFSYEKSGHARRFSYTHGIAGYVSRSGIPMLIENNVQGSTYFNTGVDQRKNRITQSLLCCPLKANNKEESIIGVISLFNEKVSGFKENTLHDLQVFAVSCALYLQHATQISTLVGTPINKKQKDDNYYLTHHRGMQLASHDISTFQFHMSDITLNECIGSGSSGEVYSAYLDQYDSSIAVKKINLHGLRSEHIAAFCSEAALMCQLDDSNVVRFIGAVSEPPHLCILTEFCERGSLCDILLDYESYPDLPFETLINFAIDAAQGMRYLHACNPVIVHRDLKSDNLLVDSSWRAKVADFGLSTFASRRKSLSAVGSPCWMAPEVILGKGDISEKCDVYSFGIILWEIMTRSEPYDGRDGVQICMAVVSDELRPTISEEHADNPLVPLMKECWDADPNKRPTFKMIIEKLELIDKFYDYRKNDPDFDENSLHVRGYLCDDGLYRGPAEFQIRPPPADLSLSFSSIRGIDDFNAEELGTPRFTPSKGHSVNRFMIPSKEQKQSSGGLFKTKTFVSDE